MLSVLYCRRPATVLSANDSLRCDLAGGIADLVQLLRKLLSRPDDSQQKHEPECLLAATQRNTDTMTLFFKYAEDADLLIRDDTASFESLPLKFLCLPAETRKAVRLLHVEPR